MSERMTERDALELYRDYLDMVNDPVRIGSLEYLPSRVLEEVDPIAFRCGFHDFLDAEGIDSDDLE